MIPIIEKLYKDKPEEKAAALQRHLEFFNTTPHMVTLILGISTAMEEENALDENFDTSSINSVKAGLMGPLAGIGDSFYVGNTSNNCNWNRNITCYEREYSGTNFILPIV